MSGFINKNDIIINNEFYFNTYIQIDWLMSFNKLCIGKKHNLSFISKILFLLKSTSVTESRH